MTIPKIQLKMADEIERVIRNSLREKKAKYQQPHGQDTLNDLRALTLRQGLTAPIRPPKPFSGGYGEHFGEWIIRFERFLALQGIRETDVTLKAASLESYLTGSAYASIEDLYQGQRLAPTYEQIKRHLEVTYPDNRDSDWQQRLLMDRQQNASESVSEY